MRIYACIYNIITIIYFRCIYTLDAGEGNGNLLYYSFLENPMDIVPGGLQSMGSQSDTTEVT